MLRCMGCMTLLEQNETTCPHCGYVRGTPPREAFHLAPETILHGRYVVGRVLGCGGFGVTYIGYDAALERPVAIKEFLPATFATRVPGSTAVTVYEGNATAQFSAGLTRFVEEAQTLAQFNGVPGIVDIYDSFAGNETAYIIMQFLRGQDVKHILNASGPLPYETAREIILAVCDTLAPVHAKGIIHRDISPDNIFITTESEIKLLDFGAARYESAVNSKSLSVILKSGYAPEEQYRSKGEQGPWTDVYALAATFYKMLTGTTPPDSMERAIQDEIKEPSTLGAELPQSVENALMNALCVRKADRTQNAAAFKTALLADGVERTKVKQTSARASRAPVVAGIAIAVCVCVLVGLGLFAAGGGFAQGPIVVGGTMLEDTYGTTEKEGFATLPLLVGKTEAEATATLEEMGFVVERSGVLFSKEPLQTPLVAEQTPVAGKQLALGETVQLKVDMGELQNAMNAGLTKHIKDMTPEEVDAFEETFDPKNSYAHLWRGYDYSDTVPLGHGLRVEAEPPEDGQQVRYALIASAGPTTATPYGELRQVKLQHSRLYGLVASDGVTDTDWYTVSFHALASADGGSSWVELSSGTGYRTEHFGAPTQSSVPLADPLQMFHPQLANKDLLLRLERRVTPRDPNTNEAGETTVLDAMTLEQPLRFTMDVPAPEITSVEKLSLAEIETLLAQEAFDSGDIGTIDHLLAETEKLQEAYGAEQAPMDWAVLRLKGGFLTDIDGVRTRYTILYEKPEGHVMGNQQPDARCTTNGELYVMLRSYNAGDDGETPLKRRITVMLDTARVQRGEDGSWSFSGANATTVEFTTR